MNTQADHNPRPSLEDPGRKSVVLAVVLSALPGLGQVYVGYYPRGFTHSLVAASLIAVLSSLTEFSPLFPLGMIFLFFFWFYNMIDAGRRAAMYNHVLAGGEIVDLPKDISIPGLRGSIVGGLVIIAVGAIVLSHTAYDVPLDWLEDWWPAGVVLFGVYLVVKGVQERVGTSLG
ncbi:MAG TPA: hypothetical protein VD788_08650 [Candidatus Polarisedimenticolaceae bacterium]|nr:hypothetical protein [Candidatus Polarisedimenticolaceae bacterium]